MVLQSRPEDVILTGPCVPGRRDVFGVVKSLLLCEGPPLFSYRMTVPDHPFDQVILVCEDGQRRCCITFGFSLTDQELKLLEDSTFTLGEFSHNRPLL